MLRQRGSLREHVRQGVQEHCAAVGRVAHLSGLHRNRPDHGMGQQGHRNQVKHLIDRNEPLYMEVALKRMWQSSITR